MFDFATAFSAPARHDAGPPPPGGHSVEIATADARVSGWYFAGAPDAGGVILLHGIRSNKGSQAHKIALFRDAGFSVLAIDLQAHGNSSGDRITFGIRESDSVVSAIAWLKKKRPGRKIAIVGQSLGAAAGLIAATRMSVHALVLEAPFGDLTTALANRVALRIGDWSRPLAPFVMRVGDSLMGIDSPRLVLRERIKGVRTPVMVMTGGADRLATKAEARAIFAAANEPKTFLVVENAGHVDLLVAGGDSYRTHVLAFIANAFASR